MELCCAVTKYPSLQLPIAQRKLGSCGLHCVSVIQQKKHVVLGLCWYEQVLDDDNLVLQGGSIDGIAAWLVVRQIVSGLAHIHSQATILPHKPFNTLTATTTGHCCLSSQSLWRDSEHFDRAHWVRFL